MKFIANKNCVISNSTGGVVTVKSVESQKVKVMNIGVFFTKIDVTLTGAVQGNFTQVKPQDFTIQSTSLKSISGGFVLREGDFVTGVVDGVDPNGNTGIINVKIEIVNAGQTKVRSK